MKNYNKNFLEQITINKLVHYLLLFALGWVIVQVLAYFSTVIIIFILAAVLAFILTYPVQWVNRFLPHTLAVVVVFLSSLLLVGILIFTIGFAILSQGQQLFALLIGATVAGLLGIFLAVPIAGVIISLFEMHELKAEQM